MNHPRPIEPSSRYRHGAGRRAPGDRPRREQEGIVMLALMLIIVMLSATAVFAMRTTAEQVRAAGASQRHVQLQAMALGTAGAALTWSDFAEPTSLFACMTSGNTYALEPFEPDPPAGAEMCRVSKDDFDVLTGTGPAVPPVTQEASLGPNTSPRNIFSFADFNDRVQAPPVQMPGFRVDEEGPTFYQVTMTARTVLNLQSGDPTVAINGVDVPIHQKVSAARAYLIVGPAL